MNRIFVTGAPGSKWSSVVKNIYYSNSIDRSDSTAARSYAHHAQYAGQPMHIGAYWDPGMEFGQEFDRLDQFSRTHNELEFDRPFSGTGVRIVKSHVFALHINYLRKAWPSTPLVLVHRSTDACLGWWLRCGGFDITYPNYLPYYQDLATMTRHIEQQNCGIEQAWHLPGIEVFDNQALAKAVNINIPPAEYQQNYAEADIRVKVLVG